jgi:photosystem II stability/assembly factor-like uncharacterized protein
LYAIVSWDRGSPGTVYASSDAGEHWQSLSSPEADPFAAEILKQAQALTVTRTTPATLFIGAQQVSATSNRGVSFRHSEKLSDVVTQIEPHPTDPMVLYASSTQAGVLRSTDGGQSWSARNVGISANITRDLGLAGEGGQTLYAKLQNALVTKKPMDSRWAPQTLPFSASSFRIRFADSGGAAYAVRSIHHTGDRDSFYQFRNDGSGWVPRNLPSGASASNDVVINPSDSQLVFVTQDSGCQLLRSKDGGTTWDTLEVDPTEKRLGGSCKLALTTNPKILFATYSIRLGSNLLEADTSVYKSSDGGDHWQRLGRKFGHPTQALATHPLQASHLFACFGVVCYESTDGGENWQDFSKDLKLDVSASIVSLDVSTGDPDAVWLTTNRGIFKASIANRTWRSTNLEWKLLQAQDLLIDPRDPRHVYVSTYERGIWETWSGGE